MGRSIGLDVHRDFCEVAIADGGASAFEGTRADDARAARGLRAQPRADRPRGARGDGNALAIACILAPHVAEVVLAQAKHVRAISHAKVKTDKVDARCWPTCWRPA